MIRSVGGRPAWSRARRRASLPTLSLWRGFDFAKLNARLTLSTGVAAPCRRDAGSDRSEERLTCDRTSAVRSTSNRSGEKGRKPFLQVEEGPAWDRPPPTRCARTTVRVARAEGP